MALVTQSSYFPLSASVAFGLVRHAPVVMRSNGAPGLHYFAPLGIWDGAPIHYRLQEGIRVTAWTATICAVEPGRFSTRLAPAFRSPFSAFVAEHVFEENGNAVIVRDTLQASARIETLEAALDKAVFAYDFAGRQWQAEQRAQDETVAIETLPQANAG
jgi:hypothetical protein